MAEVAGKVSRRGDRQGRQGHRHRLAAARSTPTRFPARTRLHVADGDKVEVGQQLNEGSLYPADLLAIRGRTDTEVYLVREVQHVYRAQGVDINDKHIELIVRQMLKKVRVESKGSTSLLPGQLEDRQSLKRLNKEVKDGGGTPAKAEEVILGITKASLATESFLSAASFQETTKVLTDAALEGKRDRLVGLKENVIIGKLIPAATGLQATTGRWRSSRPSRSSRPPRRACSTRRSSPPSSASRATAAPPRASGPRSPRSSRSWRRRSTRPRTAAAAAAATTSLNRNGPVPTLSVIVPATDRPGDARALPRRGALLRRLPGGGAGRSTSRSATARLAARNAGAELRRGEVLVVRRLRRRRPIPQAPAASDRRSPIPAWRPSSAPTSRVPRAARCRRLSQPAPPSTSTAASAGPAQTFWAGLGAVRRHRVLAERRLRREPLPAALDRGRRAGVCGSPSSRARHRDRPADHGPTPRSAGRLLSMLRTDVSDRGAPWVALMLRERGGSRRPSTSAGATASAPPSFSPASARWPAGRRGLALAAPARAWPGSTGRFYGLLWRAGRAPAWRQRGGSRPARRPPPGLGRGGSGRDPPPRPRWLMQPVSLGCAR